MKKFLIILLLFCSCGSAIKISPPPSDSTKWIMWLADENTEFLDKMEKNWSLGNGCNENIVNISLSGNLDMQGHTLELLNVDLKINGLLLNRGPLKWICDNAIIWTQNENKSKIIKN